MKEPLEARMEIMIISYNRARYLERTLQQLQNSPFRNCKITVLDNCSPDDTPQVCARYQAQFAQLKTVRHPKNIGLTPNYLRAVELSTSPYTWILGDDDIYDFSNCHDVIEAIENGDFDLISLGSASGVAWNAGMVTTGQELVKRSSHYFYICSFVPSMIFKTELFDSECLTKGYRNAANLFPHFEFLKKSVRDNFSIYIAKAQFIRRGGDENVLSNLHWLTAWVNSCGTVEDARLRRRLVYEINEKRFFKQLALWVALEKMQAPQHVYREMLDLAFGFSPDQRLGLLMISPLALVPSSLYKKLNQLRHGMRGKSHSKSGKVADDFRL